MDRMLNAISNRQDPSVDVNRVAQAIQSKAVKTSTNAHQCCRWIRTGRVEQVQSVSMCLVATSVSALLASWVIRTKKAARAQLVAMQTSIVPTILSAISTRASASMLAHLLCVEPIPIVWPWIMWQHVNASLVTMERRPIPREAVHHLVPTFSVV